MRTVWGVLDDIAKKSSAAFGLSKRYDGLCSPDIAGICASQEEAKSATALQTRFDHRNASRKSRTVFRAAHFGLAALTLTSAQAWASDVTISCDGTPSATQTLCQNAGNFCDNTGVSQNLNDQITVTGVQPNDVVTINLSNPGGATPISVTFQAQNSDGVPPNVSYPTQTSSSYTVQGSDGSTYTTRIAVGTNARSIRFSATCVRPAPTTGYLRINKTRIGGDASFTVGATLGQAVTNFGLSSSNSYTETKEVPLGNYTVSETAPSGWDLVGINCGDGPNDTSVSVSASNSSTNPAVCTVTNRKKSFIKLTKNATGGSGQITFPISVDENGPNQAPAATSVNVQTNNGTGFTLYEVQDGTFTISEPNPPTGWSLDNINCGGSPGQTANVTVAAGQTKECVITNRRGARLTILKDVPDYDDNTQFGFRKSGPGGNNVPFNLTDGGTGQVYTVTGQYTITEDGEDGYRLTNVQCSGTGWGGQGDSTSVQNRRATINLQSGDDITCTFTNNRQMGRIKIRKEAPNGQTFNGPFKVRLDGNLVAASYGNSEESPADGLEIGQMTRYIEVSVGNHTISETDLPTGWRVDQITCSRDGGGDDDDDDDDDDRRDSSYQSVSSYSDSNDNSFRVNVRDGKDYTCTVRNRREGGTIEIIKQSVNGASFADPFKIYLDGNIVGQDGLTINESSGPIQVSTGKHYVTEPANELPDGWTLDSISCSKIGGGDDDDDDDDDDKDYQKNSVVSVDDYSSGSSDGSVDVKDGKSYRCYVRNRATASLTIRKLSIGGVGTFGFSGDRSFDITTAAPNTPTANGSSTFVNLDPGLYTISETSLPSTDWVLQGIDGDGCTREGNSVKVDLKPGDVRVCTFVNFKQTDDRMDEVTQLFVHRRVDNLLTHGPDRARLLRRLQDSAEPPQSLKDTGPIKLNGNQATLNNQGFLGLGSSANPYSSQTAIRNGEVYQSNDYAVGQGDRGSDYYGASETAPAANSIFSQIAGQLTTIAGGTSNFKFSTSLSELRQAATEAEQRKQEQLLKDSGLSFGEGLSNRTQTLRQGWDIWAEGHISKYNDGLGGYDRDGDFRVLYVGADYALAPGVLIGALVQVDDTKEDVANAGLIGEVEGTGWLAGPYIGIKLADNLFFDARAAYGTSDNDIWLQDAAAGYRSGSFKTDRWLASATLTGNQYFGNFRLSPQFGFSYGNEWYDDYFNSIGQLVPGRDISIGRLNATIEAGYRFDMPDGTTIEPHVSISGLVNFTGDDLIIGGQVVDPNDSRAKLEGGVIVRTPQGYAIRAAGAYDGIGQEDFEAYSGSLWINVPLN